MLRLRGKGPDGKGPDGKGPDGKGPDWNSERGSALILMPAAVLILVILAALALDSALVYLGQRQLSDAAASAAADAAGSISDAAFYQHGLVILNPAQAVQVAMASIGAQQFSQVRLSGSPDIEVVGNQVCVALTGSVTHIFGLAIPGIDHITTVMARATATAAGASGPVVKHRRVC